MTPLRTAALTGILLFSSSLATADDATKVFDSLFRSRLDAAAKTADKADDVALAVVLLDAAKGSSDQPALLEIMCLKAYELGEKDDAGTATAAEAMELLATAVPARALAAKEKVAALHRRVYIKARDDARSAAGLKLVEALSSLAEAHVAAEDFAGAVTTYKQAMNVARTLKAGNQEELKLRHDAVVSKQQLTRQLEQLEEQVLRDANDAGAAKQLAMLLLVDFDDPKAAAKYAGRVKDATLAARLKHANADPASLAEAACLEMGDWYRVLADAAKDAAKVAMYQRSHVYLERYLVLHAAQDVARKGAELAKADIEKKLLALGARAVAAKPSPATTVPGVPQPAAGASKITDKSFAEGKSVEVLGLVDLKTNCPSGKWTIQDNALVSEPERDKVATMFVPVAIAGDYEVTFNWRASPGNGLFSVLMPTPKGYVNAHAVLSGPTEMNDGVIKTYTISVKENSVVIDAATGNRLDPRGEVPERDLLKKIADLPDAPVLAIRMLGPSITIKSIKIRMITGEAKLWTPEAPKAGAPATPAVAANAKAEDWIDLIKLIDLDADTIKGKWTKEGKGMLGPSDSGAKVAVPLLPQGDYVLKLAFQRKVGVDSVNIVIPVGDTHAMVVIDGWSEMGSRSCLEAIGARPGFANETTIRGMQLTNGKTHKAEITVQVRDDRAAVKVTLDGKRFIDWSGKTAALSTGWAVSKGQIGLGSSSASVLYEEAQIRMLTGEAKPTREQK